MSNSYCAWFVPAAHIAGANAIINLIWEQPVESQNFTLHFNTSGLPANPIEYYAAHPHLSSAEALVFDNLSENIPTPSGGWPVMVGDVEVSEADAIAAAAAFGYYRTNNASAGNIAYGASTIGVSPIVYPSEG